LAGENEFTWKQNQTVILGGRRVSGFLVIEDGMPLRRDVPSIHLKDFAAIVEQSCVEYYQELTRPVAPPMPFGFVFVPRLEKGATSATHRSAVGDRAGRGASVAIATRAVGL
jgi:hypothetical protein